MGGCETPALAPLQKVVHGISVWFARLERLEAIARVVGDAHHEGIAVVDGRSIVGRADALGLSLARRGHNTGSDHQQCQQQDRARKAAKQAHGMEREIRIEYEAERGTPEPKQFQRSLAVRLA